MPEIRHWYEFADVLANRGLLDAVAEVGVAQGLRASDLISWGAKKIYLVDAWKHIPDATGDAANPQAWHDKNYAACMNRNSGRGAEVIALRGLSNEMAVNVPDASLGFCYLDACHSFENVKADLEAWFPKVRSGGILAGHDYLALEYGVYGAVTEFTAARNLEVNVVREDDAQNASFWFNKP